MRTAIAALLAALTIAICIGYRTADRAVMADNQVYFFVTERAASGVPPHVSERDVKTHLSTLLGAAVLRTGRAAGVDDVRAGRVLSVACGAASVVLVGMLTLELTGVGVAALVAALSMFAFHGFVLESASGFQPKIPMVVFLLSALLATARRRPLLAGIAGACSVLCWQPSGVVLAGCAVALVVDARPGRRAALGRMAAGAAVAVLLYEGWFLWNGALAEQLHQEVVLVVGAQLKPVEWKASLWFILCEAVPGRLRPNALPTLFFATFGASLLAALLRPLRAASVLREHPGLVAFWVTSMLGVAYTVVDHQAHPDLLLLQPLFAVAGGLALAAAIAWLRPRAGERVPSALAAMLFLAWMVPLVAPRVRHEWATAPKLEDQRSLAQLLDLYTDHRGSVQVFGSLHLLALLHQDNWVNVGFLGREVADLDMTTWRPLRGDGMPEVIVAGRGFRPGGKTWLRSEYVDVTPKAFAWNRIRIYSRLTGPGFQRATAPRATPDPFYAARVAVQRAAATRPASPPVAE